MSSPTSFWTAADRGSLKLGNEQVRSYILSGPRNEAFTILVLDQDRRLVDKVLAALSKAED